MALTAYETQTQRLLQNPQAPQTLYTTVDIDSWINTARSQIAGEGECVRSIGILPTIIGTRIYAFSTITTSNAALSTPLHVRMVQAPSGGGLETLSPYPWEYFNQYIVGGRVAPTNALPTDWAQYAQGTLGSLYLNPPPDQIYDLNVDCVWQPIDLATDSTPEALPYPWTDAVPYFAAYLALMSAQSGAREQQAMRLFQLYEQFVARARQFSTPSVLPYQYEQAGVKQSMTPAGIPLMTQRGAG